MERDPYKYFRLESRDLLTQFSSGILELEKDGNTNSQVQRLLRIAHTLKGAARVVKLPDIANLAHAMEDVMAPVREPGSPVSREIIDQLLKHLDEIEGMVRALNAPAPTTAAPTAAVTSTPTASAEEQYRTVRADIAEMDGLLDGVVETHTLLNALRAAPRRLADGQQLVSILLAQLAQRSQRENSRQLAATLDRAHATADDLRKLLGGVESGLDVAIDQMDRELQQLRDAAEQLRLVSADVLFSALERLARDVAGGLGKRVNFKTSGSDIHLDAYVLTTVQGALVQIVRNAVAHGIETEAERIAAGKPPAGAVTLSVFRRAGQIVFHCEDDGRGVDLDSVRRKAEQMGQVAPGTAASADDLKIILLRGGISTSTTVTDAAGRGVGLDVVRTSLDQLGGKVTLETTAGRGTSFELVVPVSLTSLQGLVVKSGGDFVTIPLDAVQACLRVNANEISSASTGASILYEDKAVPFVSLSHALFGSSEPPRSAWSAVIVASGDTRAAVGVDELRGTARIVVRPLSARVPSSVLIAGASLNAEGNPQLVLDARGLVAEAPRIAMNTNTPPITQKPILVIDDSLTTRMLEQSILESAGYNVDVAMSGEEGLDSARRKSYALILVDVEMPGMDGFTFVEQARADPTLHNMPIILVTSRNAPEDIKRGMDVRADGYVVKGEFNQTKLLSMIKPLVARNG
jgi:two-component system chemotaxis sensor kinase CheA